MCIRDRLQPQDFPLRRQPGASLPPFRGNLATPPEGAPAQPGSLADAVNEAERRAISAAIDKYPVDLGKVAESLGVSATTLWRKMKRLGIKSHSDAVS